MKSVKVIGAGGVSGDAIGMIDDNDTRYLFNQRQYAGNLVALQRVPGASGVSWGEALAMGVGEAKL